MPPLVAPVDSFSTLGGVDLGLVHAVFEPVMRTPIPLVDLDLRCTLVEDVDLEIPFFWICFSAADVDIQGSLARARASCQGKRRGLVRGSGRAGGGALARAPGAGRLPRPARPAGHAI